MVVIEKISIIIPVLNEVGNIKIVLDRIPSSPDIETIVVDGGSIDGTLELVRSLGVEVLSSSRGRANQMNTGAKTATGEILLFLHGDTLLPPEFDRLIRAALKTPQKIPVAGAFALQIDSPLRSLRLIEWAVSWRSRWLQMPYGDQAIFLTADTFKQIGGFAPLPIMEDFELIRRLKKLGQIVFIPVPVVTSARRWLSKGIIQTTLINQIIVCAYLLGVAPERLARWYRDRQTLTIGDWFKLFS
jgi:rSAM/selenodomain-associated transferase 2